MSEQPAILPEPRCERVVVTTADGRHYDLGSPESPLFPLRLKRYERARRAELERGTSDG